MLLFTIVFVHQVFVHPPENFPEVSTGYKVHAERDRINRISVSVAQVKADESLERLHEDDRRCCMYNKMQSTENIYKSHNEDTCYSECRRRAIYKMCNCTQYFYKLYKG